LPEEYTDTLVIASRLFFAPSSSFSLLNAMLTESRLNDLDSILVFESLQFSPKAAFVIAISSTAPKTSLMTASSSKQLNVQQFLPAE
jgi:hypothetical protein